MERRTDEQVLDLLMTYDGVMRLHSEINTLMARLYKGYEVKENEYEQVLTVAMLALISLSIERRLGFDRSRR